MADLLWELRSSKHNLVARACRATRLCFEERSSQSSSAIVNSQSSTDSQNQELVVTVEEVEMDPGAKVLLEPREASSQPIEIEGEEEDHDESTPGNQPVRAKQET